MKSYIIFEEILSNVLLGVVTFIATLFVHYITVGVDLTLCFIAGFVVFLLLTLADFGKRYIDKNH